jgi:hypothetical protein
VWFVIGVRRKEHAITMESGIVGQHEWVLLCLEVAQVKRSMRVW